MKDYCRLIVELTDEIFAFPLQNGLFLEKSYTSSHYIDKVLEEKSGQQHLSTALRKVTMGLKKNQNAATALLKVRSKSTVVFELHS